jgi:dTMP kinase
LKEVNNFILKPDISIYLDVDPVTGLSRIGEKRSLFENIILEQKAREIYLEIVKEGEMVYIDSRRDVNLVEKEISDLIFKKIKVIK